MPVSPPTDRMRTARGRDHQTERTWRARDPRQRASMHLRSSAAWQRLRAVALAEEPICGDPYALHAGRVVLATEVDHVVPLRDRPDLGLTQSNLRALCRACHAHKSGKERRHGDTLSHRRG